MSPVGNSTQLLKIALGNDSDIVRVRQRTKQLCVHAKLAVQDQTRFVTAVSEIARNALQYARGGTVKFAIANSNGQHILRVTVEDRGTGIEHLQTVLSGAYVSLTGMGKGIVGAKTLCDEFGIETSESGTTVDLGKVIPLVGTKLRTDVFASWLNDLPDLSDSSAIDDLKQQNQQLALALSEIERAGKELANQQLLLEERTRQLERANQMKGEFLANMSHEIRTPLNAIIGISNVLAKSDMALEHKNLVSLLSNAGKSLLFLVNDILDLSKIEADKVQLDRRPFNLREYVKRALALVESQALEKGLRLNFFFDPGLPEIVDGDSHRLQQILLNLFTNAIKFSEHGEVNLFLLLEDANEEHCSIRFLVQDTGIGIREDDQSRLFQSFVQVDGSTSRKYGGTGLGLSICKGLVELMGGTIRLISANKVGSIFHFALPFGCQEKPRSELSSQLTSLSVCFYKSNLQPIELWMRALQMRCVHCDSVKELNLWLSENNNSNVCSTVVSHAGEPPAKVSGNTILIDGTAGLPSSILNNLLQSTEINASLEPFHMDAHETVALDPEVSEIGKGHRVLLAEDNEMNQMIGQMQLQEFGFTVDLCANGKQAVEAVQRDNYALLFMDCQMPEMDGYEATKQIRTLEQESSLATKRRIPIIAMTANALAGDREKCLEAGMDDYASKPIEPEHLRALVFKWLAPDAVPEDGDIPDATDLIDLEKLSKRFKLEQVRRLIDMFVIDTPRIFAQMESALADSDYETVSNAMHKFKGGCRIIYAEGLSKQSEVIEQSVLDEKWKDIEDEFRRLQIMFDRVRAALEDRFPKDD